jgi:acetyl/propionyl-CoA carboxylase alpha subunit
MLGKLIVWGADRAQALARLGRALSELRIEGIRTTVPLFQALLADPDFLAGNLDIGLLDRKLAAGELRPPAGGTFADLAPIAAALAHFERAGATGAAPLGGGRRARWREAARRESLRRGGLP